jgi:hypothetical protein
MENIREYQNFIFEGGKAGISPAIYKQLEEYFNSTPKPTLKGAQAHIAKTKKGWQLSQDDFTEAKRKFKKINEEFSMRGESELVGRRIKLVEMVDDPHPVEPGTEGTIYHVGGDVINVKWDNGRSLGVVMGHDLFDILD